MPDSFVHQEFCVLKKIIFVRVDKFKGRESRETECNSCWANRDSKCDTGLIVCFSAGKSKSEDSPR